MLRPAIYLDYASLVPPAPEALEAMRVASATCWGHPSSLHRFGARAETVLEIARAQVAEYADIENPQELIFTSSGRSALALAMRLALARLSPGAVIVSSRQEHVSLQTAVLDAEREGFQIVWLDMPAGVPNDSDRAALAKASLVALAAQNHEMGTSILDVLEQLPKSTLRVIDAVQLAPWLPLTSLADERTYYALSGTKLGVPPSVGVARVPSSEVYRALNAGQRLESASLPWLLAIGLGAACEARQSNRQSYLATARARADALIEMLRSHSPELSVNGDSSARVGTVASISFPACSGRSLAAALSLEGILVSHTAACQSRSVDLSPAVRAAYPADPDRAYSTVRFSVSELVTLDDISGAADRFCRLRQNNPSFRYSNHLTPKRFK